MLLVQPPLAKHAAWTVQHAAVLTRLVGDGDDDWQLTADISHDSFGSFCLFPSTDVDEDLAYAFIKLWQFNRIKACGENMSATLKSYQITRFRLPLTRTIGDSQVRHDTIFITALELYTQEGEVGLGLLNSYFFPPQPELVRIFEAEYWDALKDQPIYPLLHRLTRPRGGNNRVLLFEEAVNQALWDLYGKDVKLPLYRLLGGTTNRVKAYASGLDFHLTSAQVHDFYVDAVIRGYTAFKVKVGHPDLAWDVNRLREVVAVVGPEATLMIDANEAWSPKEAVRALHAYRDAGINVYWIEDPCLRSDFDGLARISAEVPFTFVNTGEYLDLRGKRQLLERNAVDVLNVHGRVSEVMHAAWLAAEHGIPLSLGNTTCEIGVHLAAALPEVEWLENSLIGWDALVADPIKFERGYAIAPDVPGHGLRLSEEARAEFTFAG
ncbi:MAG: mandelate racemase/muconate lactonizing enzyme family protein [Anaerolineae bacterium]|nr:mandelate racemase/muconate lactonizing enzyme family protein [Anaerolineae bacterium]